MKFILPLLALTAVAAGTAANTGFETFRRAPEVPLNIPVSADSASGPINKFDPSSLLKSRAAAIRMQTQNWTTVVPDTAGRLAFDRPGQGALLNTLYTRLRPERFTKGKLRMSTNVRARVLVDGKQVITNEAADSVAAECEAPLSLKPEQTVDIQVDLLSMADDKSAPEVSLFFVPDDKFEDVTVLTGPDLRDRVRVETVTLGARVSDVSLSPDGKMMLIRYSETYDDESSRSWTALRETATSRLIASDLPEGCRWMPKGCRLYYTEKTSDTYNLYLLDPADMQRTLLARGLEENSFNWAPDESYLIWYKEVEGKKDDGIMRRVEHPDDRQPGNRNRWYLMRHDLASGVTVPLTYGGASTSLCDISPDSKRILYLSSRFVPEQYPFYLADLVEMDVNTLRTDTLVHESPALNDAVYSPDGKSLFLLGGPSCFDNLGKNCGEHPIANDFDIQGYLFDIATRTPRAVTRDFDPSIQGSPVWNRNTGRIWFRGEEGFYSRLFSLDPKSGKIERQPVDLDYMRNFSIGDNESRWIAATGQSLHYAGRAVLVDLKSGRTSVIDDPVAELTDNIDFASSEHWKFVSRDGTEIDGLITLPPDFDPSRKYPLIVYYYGGTSPSSVGMNHPYTPEMFASRDYVVYTVNPSGTTGYGQEFSARHVNAWGDYTADDIIEGVKKFCAEHPFVDDSRIGCLGASYGGFMTQLLQTKTDLFAAAVSHAGISNVASYWGEGFWGYSYNAVAAAKSYPWTDPDLFTSHGSLFNADKIHTPLLLLHGTVDTNVPIGESIQIFNALRILDRDVELVTVEGANHVVTEYDKRKVWQATIMAWFAKYLQDDPRWWNEMF